MTKSASLVITMAAIGTASLAFATETTKCTESNTQTGVDTTSDTTIDMVNEKNAEQLAAVLAIEADTEYGAYLGGECLTCHAPSGGDGSIPVIHAKSKHYLASALLEYKNKQRANEVMQGVTNALSNEEIAALATFFSEQ